MANMTPYSFVMSFIASSDKYRQQFIDKWREVVSNFIVDGAQDQPSAGITSPYSRQKVYRPARNQIYLRDPETHKLVMTFAAKLVRSVLGSRDGKFVEAQPVGYEDAAKAQAATRLIRYCFYIPGHFRTLVEAVVDMLLIGTSIVECFWRYEEKLVTVREVVSDGVTEASTTMTQVIPVYDDPCIRVVDVMDFYPDPARYRIEDMSGCAKKFKMNSFEAMAKMRGKVFDRAATLAALGPVSADSGESEEDSFRAGQDQPSEREPVPDFKEMTGYEYWGDIPEEVKAKDTDTGELVTRGVITILNQQVVRVKAWPLTNYRLPFHSFVINPVQGRFYGISPAEVVRFDQSFLDAMKILLAEAVVRMVHPPIAYDADADFDVAKLREWRADLPIPVRGGPSAIGTLQYNADINAGFNLMAGLKQEVQGGSGALGSLQGEEGPDREAATVGAARYQAALDRPELAGMVLEQDCLPALTQSMFALCQQFITDTEDLKKRIGEVPEPIWIGDILGKYDIRFVGSRNAMSNQEKLQAYDRMIAYAAAVPAFQAILPNQDIAKMVVGEWLNMPEAAMAIGDPQQVLMNLLLTRAQGGPGGQAQNGVPPSAEPAGMTPAQAGGGYVG